jgi:hypothetical protein
MNEFSPPLNPYKNAGITRIIKAGGYSLQGLRSAWASEAAFRQECVLALLVIPVIVLVDLSVVERCRAERGCRSCQSAGSVDYGTGTRH